MRDRGGFVQTFKSILLNLLLLIPILYGLLGMVGISYIAIQYPQISATLDDTTQQLNQIKVTLSQDFNVPLPMQDFKANFHDMAKKLRTTASTLTDICVGEFLGICVYTVHMYETSNSLYGVASNIDNIPNTIPSSVNVANPMKGEAWRIDTIINSIPMIKNAIIGVLIYKFLEHLCFFSIGLYLLLQRFENRERIKKLSKKVPNYD